MANHSEADSVTLIWERAEPVARGATAPPDRERITQAAFEIADREGLHAVSVKRVASKLRVPSARLEVYLTSREDLLELMLDAAFGEIDPPEDSDADWRTKLRDLATATQTTAQQHPWLRTLAGTRTPCGPNGLRNSERALAAMDGLGLDAAKMTQAVNTVLAYVYGFVQLELLEPSRRLDEDSELERRNHTARYLLGRVSTGDYPTLARVFSDASQLTAANAFESGLDYVLDGIARSLDAAASPAGAESNAVPDPTPASAQAETSAAREAGRIRIGRRRATG